MSYTPSYACCTYRHEDKDSRRIARNLFLLRVEVIERSGEPASPTQYVPPHEHRQVLVRDLPYSVARDPTRQQINSRANQPTLICALMGPASVHTMSGAMQWKT